MASDAQTTNPQQITNYQVLLRNFSGEFTNITTMVSQMNIYENLFTFTNTCDLVVGDAVGFVERVPLVGDEHIVISYKSARLDKVIIRSFKLYKVGKRKEGAQRQMNYILHGISEYSIFNEKRNIDKSFAGSKTSKAIEDAFANGFANSGGADGAEIVAKKVLYGLNKEAIVESESVTSFIPPGITPFECIKYLKDECRHPDTNNNSDYLFYEDYLGFHFTTMKELKDQETREGMKFLLGDQAHVKGGDDFDASNIIVNVTVKKTFDRLQDLGTGLFRNRIAVVDPLTKKFDTRTFIYFNEFGNLNKIHDFGARVIARNSQYRFIESSTHTRYFAAELNTTTLNRKIPPAFSPGPKFSGGQETGDVDNYMDHPYIKDVDKQTLIDKDPQVSNPTIKQRKLGLRIAERATVDAVVLDVTIPGNSDVKIGDMVEIFVPQPTSAEGEDKNFNLFYGRADDGRFAPRFLVTGVRHTYDNEKQNYLTLMEVMKDSYAQEIEDIHAKTRESMQ